MLPNNFKESLICVQNACQKLGYTFQYQDKNQILAKVILPNHQFLYFLHNKNPFNNYTSSKICNDKDLTYQILNQTNLNQPFTRSYFNPLHKTEFDEYKQFTDVLSIYNDILANFTFPFIIKKHNSSLSQSVYKIQSPQDLNTTLENYFRPDEFCILLVQDFIQGTEYRVIAFDGEVLLAYNKSQKFQNLQLKSLNPPQKVTCQKLLEQFNKISQIICKEISVRFIGIDVFVDQSQDLVIIEVNSNPACFYYNKFNGREDFTEVYLKCLQKY